MSPDGLAGLDLTWLSNLDFAGSLAEGSPVRAGLAVWAWWHDKNFLTLDSRRPPVSWDLGGLFSLAPAADWSLKLGGGYKGASDDGLAARYPEAADLLLQEALRGSASGTLAVEWTPGLWLAGLSAGLERPGSGLTGLELSCSLGRQDRLARDLGIDWSLKANLSWQDLQDPVSGPDFRGGLRLGVKGGWGHVTCQTGLGREDVFVPGAGSGFPEAGGRAGEEAAGAGAETMFRASLEVERNIEPDRGPAGKGRESARKNSGGGLAGGALREALAAVGLKLAFAESVSTDRLVVPGLADLLVLSCWYRLVLP